MPRVTTPQLGLLRNMARAGEMFARMALDTYDRTGALETGSVAQLLNNRVISGFTLSDPTTPCTQAEGNVPPVIRVNCGMGSYIVGGAAVNFMRAEDLPVPNAPVLTETDYLVNCVMVFGVRGNTLVSETPKFVFGSPTNWDAPGMAGGPPFPSDAAVLAAIGNGADSFLKVDSFTVERSGTTVYLTFSDGTLYRTDGIIVPKSEYLEHVASFGRPVADLVAYGLDNVMTLGVTGLPDNVESIAVQVMAGAAGRCQLSALADPAFGTAHFIQNTEGGVFHVGSFLRPEASEENPYRSIRFSLPFLVDDKAHLIVLADHCTAISKPLFAPL